MDKDEIIKLMFESGMFSIPSRSPLSVDTPPPTKSSLPDLPPNHPIIRYRDGKLSKEDLCSKLGIEESQLLLYLINHRELLG